MGGEGSGCQVIMQAGKKENQGSKEPVAVARHRKG